MSVRSNKEVADFIRNLAVVAGTHCTRVSAEQLRDWADCIDPPKGLPAWFDAAGLVRHLSRLGALEDVMREACAVYGITLVMDEDVRFQMRAKLTEKTDDQH